MRDPADSGDTWLMETIVVGVDGSKPSERALHWAIEHASEGDVIRAVYVWQVHRGALPDVVPLAELERIRPQADHFVGDVVDRVVAEFDGPLPEIAQVSYYGHPGRWLVDLSDEVDLVVVGGRGLGGLKGLVLGSVSNYVVSHSRCPVVVIPPEPEDDSAPPR
jgi:nucleotide-binding universal stress UspA family protein